MTLFKVHVLHVPGVDPERDRVVQIQRDEMGACVHEDPQRRGCMWNWLKCIQCATKDTSEWSLVISDDALPLNGWEQHLPLALEHSPRDILGLTHFGQYGKKLVDRGIPYGVCRESVWGGAIAYRRHVVLPLAQWTTDLYNQTGYPHDDIAVCAFAQRGDKPGVAMTSRAIFGQPILKSLLGHTSPGGSRHPLATIETDPDLQWDAEPRTGAAGTSGRKRELEQLSTGDWAPWVKRLPKRR